MTDLRLITARERIAELRGPKILITGVPGVGKTTLLTTVSPITLPSVLFMEAEAGDIAIGDLPVASIHPRTWINCRDIACAIGGPNPAFSPTAAYSDAHYKAIIADPVLASLAQYTTLFVDSLTEISRQCRVWAEGQPESYTDLGKKDLRATYGLVARELIGWLQQLQHARERTVIFTAILEKVTDDFGAANWRIQLEGQRNKVSRAFICQPNNLWGYPAKDHSGRLEQIEEPNLGRLLSKLSNSATGKGNESNDT
jgi:hypothetical protein